MRHEVSLFTVILLASYGLALWASRPADDAKNDKQTILRLEAEDIVSLRYVEPELKVEVARRKQARPGQGDFWVTHQKTTTPPSNPHAPKDETAAEPEPTTVTTTFKANEKLAEDILAKLAPFEAYRLIGKVPDENQDEYGFADDEKKLEIATKDRTYTFEIGKKSYGSRNRFVKADDGRVLLVDDSMFETMEKANLRMFERKLVAFNEDDVSHAVIKTQTGDKRMAHTIRDKQGKLAWSDASEDAQVNTTYQSWMDKISRLRLMNFADENQEQELALVEPFLTVTYETNGNILDTVAFKKLSAKAVGDTKSPTEYWVKSDYLGTHASLSENRVGPIEADAAMVIEK